MNPTDREEVARLLHGDLALTPGRTYTEAELAEVDAALLYAVTPPAPDAWAGPWTDGDADAAGVTSADVREMKR